MMSNITKWRAVSPAGLPDWISLTHTGPHGGLNERNSSNVTQRTCCSRTVNGCEEMKSQQSPLFGSGLLTKTGRQAWMHTYRITAPCCTCKGFKWGHNRAAILSRATTATAFRTDMKRHEERRKDQICVEMDAVQTFSCSCFQLLSVWMFLLQGHRLWMFSSTFKWFKCPV